VSRQGFILLHRQIQEHWLYPTDREFTEYEAWLHLIQIAAHTSHQKMVNGRMITIHRGEIATSERRLAEMFRWGRKRASRFLKMLEKDGMVLAQNWTTKWATLKINNYETFQNKKGDVGTTNRTADDTTKEATEEPQGLPQTSWNSAQGVAKKGTINNGRNNGKRNTHTPAKAGARKQISPEAREIVTFLSDCLKERGAR
jgi:DNA replication protein DnaD